MARWFVADIRKKLRHLVRRGFVSNPARRKRQGLCKIPADVIIKARDDTAAQVNRILLTFVSTVAFCLLFLFTPDNALLASAGEKLGLPSAGPVSLLGFMLLGPAVLIVLRIYLQIYAERGRRLNRVADTIRGPVIAPDKNPLLRSFRALAFYLLLPLAMLALWWKAAVLPAYGMYLCFLAAAVISMHLAMLFGRLSWRVSGTMCK
jgi:hypothetical protein